MMLLGDLMPEEGFEAWNGRRAPFFINVAPNSPWCVGTPNALSQPPWLRQIAGVQVFQLQNLGSQRGPLQKPATAGVLRQINSGTSAK